MRADNILVTTDFSADSEIAFEYAAYAAKMDGAHLTLLVVASDWQIPAEMYSSIITFERIEEYRKYLYEVAMERLESYRARFHDQKITLKVILSLKPVAQEICDYAEKNSINLIIMATHGRGAMGALFLGSTLQKVLQTAPCPVLVVPKPRKVK